MIFFGPTGFLKRTIDKLRLRKTWHHVFAHISDTLNKQAQILKIELKHVRNSNWQARRA